MGFLDVEIPDWLKPPSPADQAKARSQAMQTGLQIGAQAYQNQLQREHSWDMEKMRLAQGMDQFQQRLTLDKEKFAVDKQLDDLKIGMVRQDLESQPKIIEYLNRIGKMTSPEEIESTPVPDGLGAQGIQLIENARRSAFANAMTLKAKSTDQQILNHYLTFADSAARRGHMAQSALMLSVLKKNNGILSEEDANQLNAIATDIERKDLDRAIELKRVDQEGRMDLLRARLGIVPGSPQQPYAGGKLFHVLPEPFNKLFEKQAESLEPFDQYKLYQQYTRMAGMPVPPDLPEDVLKTMKPDQGKKSGSWIPQFMRDLWMKHGGPPLPAEQDQPGAFREDRPYSQQNTEQPSIPPVNPVKKTESVDQYNRRLIDAAKQSNPRRRQVKGKWEILVTDDEGNTKWLIDDTFGK